VRKGVRKSGLSAMYSTLLKTNSREEQLTIISMLIRRIMVCYSDLVAKDII
jgi:hypothetical protein